MSVQVQALYVEHHAWLRGWLQRRLGCGYQAADLAHDTFLRLLNRRSADSPATLHQPRAYLATVAKGVLINWYQHQAVERAYAEAVAHLPPELVPSPEERMAHIQALSAIDSALQQLPARVRQAFYLSQLDGLKYEAIAAELGVSLPTVKRYMQQAFAQCLNSTA